MLTWASHPHLGLVSLCLGTQRRGPDCASMGLDLCCGSLLKRKFGLCSKQAVFLRRTARTSCLRLRERTQCPDPGPVGQATQNHFQGGDTALSQRVLSCARRLPWPFIWGFSLPYLSSWLLTWSLKSHKAGKACFDEPRPWARCGVR